MIFLSHSAGAFVPRLWPYLDHAAGSRSIHLRSPICQLDDPAPSTFLITLAWDTQRPFPVFNCPRSRLLFGL